MVKTDPLPVLWATELRFLVSWMVTRPGRKLQGKIRPASVEGEVDRCKRGSFRVKWIWTERGIEMSPLVYDTKTTCEQCAFCSVGEHCLHAALQEKSWTALVWATR